MNDRNILLNAGWLSYKKARIANKNAGNSRAKAIIESDTRKKPRSRLRASIMIKLAAIKSPMAITESHTAITLPHHIIAQDANL